MDKKQTHKNAGHRRRLRQKFRDFGLTGFHDYEVVELLLTLGTPRKDCKESAKSALAYFKTLPAVIDASPEELCTIKGIGPNNLFGIKLVKAVADRYLEQKVIGRDPISNSKELLDYLYHSIQDKARECFSVLFLDAKNKVISSQVLFKGTLTASAVYPREVVRKALDQKAAGLICVHNHPSGDPTPSAEDMAITRQLVFSCRMMGITVHEHLIIGDKEYYSFADKGHIRQLNEEYTKRH